MKPRRARFLLVVALATIVPTLARAEGYLYSPYTSDVTLVGAAWSYAKPLRAMQEQFLYAWSPQGFEAEFRTRLASRVSVGGDFTYNAFSQDFSGGTHREFEAIAVRATVHWYLTGTSVQPYVGFGVGGVHRDASQDGAQVHADFAALVEPQAGLLLTIDRGLALNLSVRYAFTHPSLDVVGRPEWLSAQIGLAVY